MGDIIVGFFLSVFITLFIIISKRTKFSNTETIIKNLIGLGSIFGLLISLFQNGTEMILGLTIFGFQLLGVIVSYKQSTKNVSYLLLCVTLILQVPILNFTTLTYRCQNFFGINIQEFPGKYYDIEPGSYVSYFYRDTYTVTNPLFPIGVNLVSIILLIYFINRWRKSKSLHYC